MKQNEHWFNWHELFTTEKFNDVVPIVIGAHGAGKKYAENLWHSQNVQKLDIDDSKKGC